MANPIAQFEIKPLVELSAGGVDASLTNSGAFMILTVVTVTAFLVLGMRQRALVPGRWQSMAELSYEFVAGLLRDNVGSEGRRYFPFVFSIFMFILFANMLGLLPYSFTVTSHIIVTFAMAMSVFILITLVAIARHGVKFLTYFVPSGVPMAVLPLMVPIEIISYLSRPVSLSVRLFANMMAGHTMMKVFAGFIVPMGVAGILPFGIDVLMVGFEFLVAFLQAYVFTVLTCLYLHDAIHLH
ncbi:F0F1 ATP synthase subunit A [Magnetovibrio sp. PR-2]|uniref:F0F1 ATP synthase subunit A n=1 Tax=Magnetovibrio sp. PR-2 TaxID=3120356 RepID=UPI002FCE5F9C